MTVIQVVSTCRRCLRKTSKMKVFTRRTTIRKKVTSLSMFSSKPFLSSVSFFILNILSICKAFTHHGWISSIFARARFDSFVGERHSEHGVHILANFHLIYLYCFVCKIELRFFAKRRAPAIFRWEKKFGEIDPMCKSRLWLDQGSISLGDKYLDAYQFFRS